MTKLLVLLFTICFSPNLLAFTELTVEGSYSKKVFGSTRQNDQIKNSIGGSVAFYLFSYTALEFNYSESEEETTVRTTLETSEDSIVFQGYKTSVSNVVKGIGLRQAFAGKKSIIRPLLSIGYAKQKVRDSTEYTYKLVSTGELIRIKTPITEREDDSVFGSFSLQFNFSQRMSLSASVRTVFPAFEWDKAQDYLKYTLGLTWIL